MSAEICILTDYARPIAASKGVPLLGWEKDFLERHLLKAGIHPTSVRWECLAPREGVSERLLKLSKLKVIVPLGSTALEFLTGKQSIDKWQLSPLSPVMTFPRWDVIPTFHPSRVIKEFRLQVYVSLAFKRVREILDGKFPRTTKTLLLNPPLKETHEYLRDVVLKAEEVSVDIETGRGQINTVGLAVSPTEAIAINVLPQRLSAENHYALWSTLTDLLENQSIRKILQNFIYEAAFFSRYGITLKGVHHDTMLAQKFLWPELKCGLDHVARIYTNQPYWKDDGKSWNNIRDWQRHYRYNCLDTTGTYEAYLRQRDDIEERGLTSLFYGYLMRLGPLAQEMCARGLPVSVATLDNMKEEVTGKLEQLKSDLNGVTGETRLNPGSPIQVLAFLQAKGYSIPKRYDSATKTWKESTDQKSLKKLRLKHPKDESLPLLLQISTLRKVLSSYLNVKFDSDNRMRYSLNIHGTETGRWSGNKDAWDRGINPQTVPGGTKGTNVKKIFEAPPGRVFLECDLSKAETWFVAYDSGDETLLRMLHAGSDIHKFVAAEIFQIPEEQITKQQRQLGKKSGHGANYSMKEGTFIDSCLLEMDMVLSKKEATNVLESYHRLFPGIRLWHNRIRSEVAGRRMLQTPLGRQRYFYGRVGDDMFREAYAYRPQSTVPDVMNHLILYLSKVRAERNLNFGLLLQVHDSVLLECRTEDVSEIAEICFDYESWQPQLILPAGKLTIPVDVQTGQTWGGMSEWHRQ